MWVQPHTWTTGEVLTNWKLNTELRDKLKTLRNQMDHAVHLSFTDNISIDDATYTTISWNSADSTVGSEIWSSGDRTQLKAPVNGFYSLAVNVEWDNTSGGERIVSYQRNGVGANYDISYIEDNNGGGTVNLSGGDVIKLTTADYIEIRVFQNWGDSLAIRAGTDRTRCRWRLIGEAT